MRTGAAVTIALSLLAAPEASAALFACQMQAKDCPDCEPVPVTFTLQRSQFARPQDPGDPPRRALSEVDLDGTRFVAEGVLMITGAAGFYEEAGALGSRLMIVQPDGTARYTETPSGRRLVGTCTETQ